MGEMLDESKEGTKVYDKDMAPSLEKRVIDIIGEFSGRPQEVIHFGKPSLGCYGVLFRGNSEMVSQVRAYVEKLQEDSKKE